MKLFFSLIFFAGMVIQIIVRAPYGRRRRKAGIVDQALTRSEIAVVGGLWIGGLLLPLVYAATRLLRLADYQGTPSLRTALGGLGMVILIPALWLFWRAHHDLGVSWSPSPEIIADQQLVTTGVYSAIRHPMYASQLIWSIAQPLLLQNWIAGFGGLAAFLLLYFIRVPEEEQLMLARFGKAYRDYCQHTGRIAPDSLHGHL
jgi:protein-S-isoprenylcysteine O-methyltransferase Ste14